MTKDTAEDILREYVDFEDVNGSESVSLLPLTITDAMEEYAESKLQALREEVEDLIAIAEDVGTEYKDSFPEKKLFYNGKVNGLKEVLNLIDNL